MNPSLTIADKPIRRAQVNHAQRVLQSHPDWSRLQLAFELCGDWNWRDDTGQLKIQPCVKLLAKLSQLEMITGLPALKSGKTTSWRKGEGWAESMTLDESPIQACLKAVTPVEVIRADQKPSDREMFRHLLAKYHPIGFKGPVGESMPYLIRSRNHDPLGAMLFGSSAWTCKDRDGWIKWSDDARKRNLRFTTNNTRFLVLPWVNVPHLASHILGLVTRRLNQDWIRKYGHSIHLLETFVETELYSGTCYRAAGWQGVGETCGRGRNGSSRATKSIKSVFLRPLTQNFREALCHVPA